MINIMVSFSFHKVTLKIMHCKSYPTNYSFNLANVSISFAAIFLRGVNINLHGMVLKCVSCVQLQVFALMETLMTALNMAL